LSVCSTDMVFVAHHVSAGIRHPQSSAAEQEDIDTVTDVIPIGPRFPGQAAAILSLASGRPLMAPAGGCYYPARRSADGYLSPDCTCAKQIVSAVFAPPSCLRCGGCTHVIRHIAKGGHSTCPLPA
jgi:hypothetical protein